MKRAQRAALVQQRLQQLYPHVPRSFLRHSNPYTLLIAVLLSARCTDKKVNEVTPRLFARAADPHSMSQLPISTIQKLIRPCGLSPQKAKAISQLSQLLLKNHGGQVPQDFPSLEALPGVGHKTASVVLAVAWNIPTFPVDTHIHRLAQRWGLTRPRSVTQTEKDLKKLFPKKTGTASTPKSFSTAENTVQPTPATAHAAPSVALSTPNAPAPQKSIKPKLTTTKAGKAQRPAPALPCPPNCSHKGHRKGGGLAWPTAVPS